MSEARVPEIVIDGIGKNRFSGGLIRLDLLSASVSFDEDKGDQDSEITHRLIMSPDGFVRTVYVLNHLMKQLMDAGVIKSDQKKPAAQKKPRPGKKS